MKDGVASFTVSTVLLTTLKKAWLYRRAEMKAFKNDVEIRLEKDDLIQLLEDALSRSIFSLSFNCGEVASISLHPANKYVARITLAKPQTKCAVTLKK